eukprot:2500280-Rhodomonas_salina.1
MICSPALQQMLAAWCRETLSQCRTPQSKRVGWMAERTRLVTEHMRICFGLVQSCDMSGQGIPACYAHRSWRYLVFPPLLPGPLAGSKPTWQRDTRGQHRAPHTAPIKHLAKGTRSIPT